MINPNNNQHENGVTVNAGKRFTVDMSISVSQLHNSIKKANDTLEGVESEQLLFGSQYNKIEQSEYLYWSNTNATLYATHLNATSYTSTAVTGAIPINVTSTTLCPNLNADLWDGHQFSDYLDQAVKTTSSPTLTGITLSGITEGSILFAGSGGVVSEDNDGIFWNDTSKRIGYGTSTPNFPSHHVKEGGSLIIGYSCYVDSYASTAFYAQKARGTIASPAIVQHNDYIFEFFGQMHDGNIFRNCGELILRADTGTISSNRVPSRWEILVNDGSFGSANYIALTIDKDANVKIVNDSAYLYIGAGDDAGHKYDGTNWIFNPDLNNIGTGVMLADTDSKWCFRDTAIGIYSQADSYMDLFADGGVRIGDSASGAPTNYSQFSSTGDITFHGSAGFYPRRISQSAQPTPSVGEEVVWHDTDDGKVYKVYNDTDSGVKQTEMV